MHETKTKAPRRRIWTPRRRLGQLAIATTCSLHWPPPTLPTQYLARSSNFLRAQIAKALPEQPPHLEPRVQRSNKVLCIHLARFITVITMVLFLGNMFAGFGTLFYGTQSSSVSIGRSMLQPARRTNVPSWHPLPECNLHLERRPLPCTRGLDPLATKRRGLWGAE